MHSFLSCSSHLKSQVAHRAVFSSVDSLSFVIWFENFLEKVAMYCKLLLFYVPHRKSHVLF